MVCRIHGLQDEKSWNGLSEIIWGKEVRYRDQEGKQNKNETRGLLCHGRHPERYDGFDHAHQRADSIAPKVRGDEAMLKVAEARGVSSNEWCATDKVGVTAMRVPAEVLEPPRPTRVSRSIEVVSEASGDSCSASDESTLEDGSLRGKRQSEMLADDAITCCSGA